MVHFIGLHEWIEVTHGSPGTERMLSEYVPMQELRAPFLGSRRLVSHSFSPPPPHFLGDAVDGWVPGAFVLP